MHDEREEDEWEAGNRDGAAAAAPPPGTAATVPPPPDGLAARPAEADARTALKKDSTAGASVSAGAGCEGGGALAAATAAAAAAVSLPPRSRAPSLACNSVDLWFSPPLGTCQRRSGDGGSGSGGGGGSKGRDGGGSGDVGDREGCGGGSRGVGSGSRGVGSGSGGRLATETACRTLHQKAASERRQQQASVCGRAFEAAPPSLPEFTRNRRRLRSRRQGPVAAAQPFAVNAAPLLPVAAGVK